MIYSISRIYTALHAMTSQGVKGSGSTLRTKQYISTLLAHLPDFYSINTHYQMLFDVGYPPCRVPRVENRGTAGSRTHHRCVMRATSSAKPTPPSMARGKEPFCNGECCNSNLTRYTSGADSHYSTRVLALLLHTSLHHAARGTLPHPSADPLNQPSKK